MICKRTETLKRNYPFQKRNYNRELKVRTIYERRRVAFIPTLAYINEDLPTHASLYIAQADACSRWKTADCCKVQAEWLTVLSIAKLSYSLIFSILNSTLLFRCLPSSVSLLATGLVSP